MNPSNVKDYVLTGVSGIAVAGIAGVSPAGAADLPVKAPAPLPVAAPVWAGWYIGLNAGGAWQSNYWNSDGTSPASDNGTRNGSAFIGGGQLGYNWQQGTFVYGLEADFSGLSRASGAYITNARDQVSYGSHVTWLSTVRGRLGVTIGNGAALLYATGGLAVGHISAHSEGGIFGWPVNDYSHTKVGWTAGGGIEYMLTPHWTIGVEGLFVDLGSYTKSSDVDGKCCATVRDRMVIGRAKLNFKF